MIGRRHFILGGAAVAGLSACGGGGGSDATALSTDEAMESASSSRRRPTPSPAPSPAPEVAAKHRVVVVGGGMAGATAAKYLRLWGDAVEVTLVDRESSYTSCILSSLVLTRQRSLSSLQYGWSTLESRYGVRRVSGDVVGYDVGASAASVRLASGQTLTADRVVFAPGIAFDPVPGLSNPDLMPHAWKAGPQTTLLAQQLAAMPNGGTLVLTVPAKPYRCPPGPYERACLLADWLRVNKPRSKLIVLDANDGIVTERENFQRAFAELYPSIIEYRANQTVHHVDEASRTLFLVNSQTGGTEPSVRGDVVNLIPRQSAPALLAPLLPANGSNRFAPVDVLSYASTVSGAGRFHVIGDASATPQPKAGHIGNQEGKVCADALVRAFAGLAPDPAPVTNSACFSTITMSQASWLHALFQYRDGTMAAVPEASGASDGWSSEHFKDMNTWFNALMADTFA